MKRRNFTFVSGSTILSGLTATGLQEPVVGLNFELSISDLNVNPSSLESLVVKFDRLNITPQHLDESRSISVTVKLELENGMKAKETADNISFSNGETINLNNITTQSTDISTLLIDGINTTESSISGNINIQINQTTNSLKSYKDTFVIEDNNRDLIDNFEYRSSNPSGPYESGEDLSDYYTGYGPDGLSSFSRGDSNSIQGSKAIQMSTSNTNDNFAVSEPGDGLPNYPEQGDSIGFLTRENNGSLMGVLWGAGDANGFDGYGYEINTRVNEISIYKWTDSGNRNKIASSGASISNSTWYWMEVDFPDSNGYMETRLYQINKNDLSRGSQVDSSVSVTDTDHNDKRGVGFYKRGNDSGTTMDWIRLNPNK
jgi:hypothetical protein